MRTAPPWATVTDIRPAIVPTNDTVPSPAARTSDASAAARSTPKWPDHLPVGPNGRTTCGPRLSPRPKHIGAAPNASDKINTETIM